MRHIRHNSPNPQSPDHRSGFSLIELIVVILVIAILLAMLLPAIGSARRTARIAQVISDIKNVEASVKNFNLKYGMDPPSSFLIGGPTDYSDALGKQSLAHMRTLWPDYTFTSSSGTSPAELITAQYGIPASSFPMRLNGAECLVFFLGGPGVLFDPSVNDAIKNIIPTGFSANPVNPFLKGGTRVGPFYEFNSARLSDVNATPNGAPELLDPLPGQTQPYQYFSSSNGRGYALNPNVTAANVPDVIPNTMTSVYFQSSQGTPPSANFGYWSPKSFQIISPGFDGEYGNGGGFRENKFFNHDATQTNRDSTARAERDNITNFSGGALQP